MLTETQDKYQEVLQAAEARSRHSADWVAFFREILGVDGLVRRTFPKFDDLTAFEQSEQYETIQKLLVKLREKRPSADTETEPTRVITVRLPKSMHESLRTEAHDLRTSMNKLCISKLLQVIDEEMIPSVRAAGGSGSASGGNGAASPAQQPIAALASRPQPSPATVPYSQPHQATPPFKSAQSRF